MGTTTHRVARPKFYDHFTPTPQPSAHECHCGENAVFIDGESQPMESRQTRLRDRYRTIDESQKPMAFKR
jgi:hypothetical protein